MRSGGWSAPGRIDPDPSYRMVEQRAQRHATDAVIVTTPSSSRIASSVPDRRVTKPRPAYSGDHSLEAALWCIGRTSDFRSAVLLAANHGDDADTTAAIIGQLAGAIYGRSGIPREWLAKLAWRERLEAVARTLTQPGS